MRAKRRAIILALACVVLRDRQTGFTTLGRLDGFIDTRSGPPLANDVNQVVYEEEKRGTLRGLGRALFRNGSLWRGWVLWDPDSGPVVLNSELPRSLRNRYFRVCDINNSGCILAFAVKGEESSHAVLLEPIPEQWGK